MTTHRPPTRPDHEAPVPAGRRGSVTSVLVAMLANLGVLVSAAVVGVVVSGMLQWSHGPAKHIDEELPVAVLLLGMVLSGRVAVDIAGRHALASVACTAALVGVLGIAVSRTSEAHGDALEPWQAGVATITVLVVVGASAWLVARYRSR